METEGTAEDWYQESRAWPDEVLALRAIVLGAGLGEARKWGQPCYTDQERNILLVSERKQGAVISFFRGALLEDPEGLLVSPGPNSRHARYLIFTSVEEVSQRRAYAEGLIAQAVEAARAGKRVPPLPDEIEYIDELEERMQADEAFRGAFEGLTPGRRRAYNMHFGQAKRSSTREDRITRFTERILAGKGMHDCVCGHSERYPRCDGSHKNYA